MHSRTLRNRFLAAALTAMVLVLQPSPARAASKEIIELQDHVQQLMDMVQRLQSTMDTRFAVLQHLSEQTADNANQMTAIVNSLQQKIAAQSDANGAKLDTASGQVQALNDSVDELKSRIAKLDKSIQDMQTQLQNIQNPPAPAVAVPGAPGGPGAPPAPQAPPLKETFQAGVRDFNAAKYDVASEEFQDVIHYYLKDDLAGDAQFYLGEIASKHNKPSEAVSDYNAVIEGFPGSTKAPAARLHKAQVLLQMNRKTEAITELKSLVRRYPQSNEAKVAKSKLATLSPTHSTAR
jgi:tol-pal system protein YbgF